MVGIGIGLTGVGTACDGDNCSVLVFNHEGPRTNNGDADQPNCPSCGGPGFRVRFGVAIDQVVKEDDQSDAT